MDDENKMVDKKIPKGFQDEAIPNVTWYPVYKHRNNGKTVHMGTNEIDNRFLIPPNKCLLRKYHVHINTEVVSSAKNVEFFFSESVKYFFKYVYKEQDFAMMEVRNNIEDTNASNTVYEHN